MRNSTIKQLLKAKQLHVNVARNNLGRAHKNVEHIRKQIKILTNELEQLKQNSTKKQNRALKEALSGEFNNATHAIVCNIYEIIAQELALQHKKIWNEKQSEKSALDEVSKAQKKLTQCMQKEEKIQHILKTIGKEQAKLDEILSENI